MTTPNAALDALNELQDYADGYGMDGMKQLLEKIRTELQNAPEVVTDEDVAKLLFNVPFPSKGQLSRVKRIVDKYPNGLIITAAPNGGG